MDNSSFDAPSHRSRPALHYYLAGFAGASLSIAAAQPPTAPSEAVNADRDTSGPVTATPWTGSMGIRATTADLMVRQPPTALRSPVPEQDDVEIEQRDRSRAEPESETLPSSTPPS